MKTIKGQVAFAAVLFFSLSGLKGHANDVSPRIVGGSEVLDDRYSFMIAMYNDRAGNGDFQFACGGSYIGSGWVLTAAHCVVDSANGQVSDPGSLLLKYGVENINEEGNVVEVQRIIVHPEYDIVTSEADIALLDVGNRLETSFISLPSSSDSFPEIEGEARVAGWGTIREDGPLSPQLLETSLPLVSQPECLPFYPSSLTTNAMICAGGNRTGGKDTCQGDSGGPIFVVRNNFLVQAGIVSFGNGCARPSVPGVYTRLSNYTDWITQVAPDVPPALETSNGISNDQTANVSISQLVSGNSPQTGVISLGEVRIFEIDNSARRVELTSVTGDADLYVVSGTLFDKDDILCESIVATGIDFCALAESNGERKFALVYGYEDTNFSIESPLTSADPTGGVDVPVPGNIGNVAPPSGSTSGGGFMSLLLMLGMSISLGLRRALEKT